MNAVAASSSPARSRPPPSKRRAPLGPSLEQNGRVTRRRYAEAPPRVEYELAGPGRGMLEPLFALGRWTELYTDEVLDAQERALSGR